MQAFHISIAQGSQGSLMSKAGSWLDRRLSKLIGVSDVPEGQAEASKPPPGPQHRRSSSQTEMPRVSPSHITVSRDCYCFADPARSDY